ncbi:hypothetical protein [Actinopolymorpha sp. B11F2]
MAVGVGVGVRVGSPVREVVVGVGLGEAVADGRAFSVSLSRPARLAG